jgi:hypothetical protein
MTKLAEKIAEEIFRTIEFEKRLVKDDIIAATHRVLMAEGIGEAFDDQTDPVEYRPDVQTLLRRAAQLREAQQDWCEKYEDMAKKITNPTTGTEEHRIMIEAAISAREELDSLPVPVRLTAPGGAHKSPEVQKWLEDVSSALTDAGVGDAALEAVSHMMANGQAMISVTDEGARCVPPEEWMRNPQDPKLIKALKCFDADQEWIDETHDKIMATVKEFGIHEIGEVCVVDDIDNETVNIEVRSPSLGTDMMFNEKNEQLRHYCVRNDFAFAEISDASLCCTFMVKACGAQPHKDPDGDK